MKFYNPFKWHIIEHEGLFLVRRYSFLFCWEYLDCLPMTTNTWKFSLRYATFLTLEEAKFKLKIHKQLTTAPSNKRINVGKIKVHV